MIADNYAKAIFFLLLAGLLLAINLRTFSKPFQKRLTFYAMWVAIAVAILSAYRVLPS